SAERFVPGLGFVQTQAPAPRVAPAAALLPGNQVLVIGGRDPGNGQFRNSCEIYTPTPGTTSGVITLADSMNQPRSDAVALVLEDGSDRVVVIGGRGSAPVDKIEIFDPHAIGGARFVGGASNPAFARFGFGAAVVPGFSGQRILIAGGVKSNS